MRGFPSWQRAAFRQAVVRAIRPAGVALILAVAVAGPFPGSGRFNRPGGPVQAGAVPAGLPTAANCDASGSVTIAAPAPGTTKTVDTGLLGADCNPIVVTLGTSDGAAVPPAGGGAHGQ